MEEREGRKGGRKFKAMIVLRGEKNDNEYRGEKNPKGISLCQK